MANQLTMALIDTILTLDQRGWSQRRIARELNIHRETVARYLQAHAAASKPAIAPTGSDADQAPPKPAIAPAGSDTGQAAAHGTMLPAEGATAAAPHMLPRPQPETDSDRAGRVGRPSDCESHRAVIVAKLDQGLSAQRIFQDLANDHGFAGSYFSVRRFVARLQQSTTLPFRRLECQPGEEAQIDFGTGAPLVLADGSRRRTHVLRVVLSYSRKAYSEVVLRQTTDELLRCLENAFWSFGGVPARLVPDNLRAVVTQADWYDPELNPKVRVFAAHYGTVWLPTRPRTPRHKGKVERGVGYVQDNALKGQTFTSLEEENTYLRQWEQNVADTRVHGTTRQQVGQLFRTVERPALLPLPRERFAHFHEEQRTVHRDGHVCVARAYYSVPPEQVARRVWVRWDGRLVRIFNDRLELLTVHVQQEPGRFSTQAGHVPREKVSSTEHGAAALLAKVSRVGGQALAWSQALLQSRGVEGVRVLAGLLSLTQRHAAAAIDRACGLAHGHGCYRLRTVRELLARQPAGAEELPFLEDHPLIRSLSEYDQVVRDVVRKESDA